MGTRRTRVVAVFVLIVLIVVFRHFAIATVRAHRTLHAIAFCETEWSAHGRVCRSAPFVDDGQYIAYSADVNRAVLGQRRAFCQVDLIGQRLV